MLHRPRFARHLSVRVVAPDAVEIRSERRRTSIPGRLLPLVVPLIDGRRTIDAIIDHLDDQASPLEVSFAMSMLAEAGYLTEAHDDEWAGAGFMAALDGSVPASPQTPACAVVSLDPAAPLESIAGLLQDAGATIAENSAFTIVVTASYSDARLAAIHDQALRTGGSWLLVKPTGSIVWVGPLFTPSSVCWRCLERRLLANTAAAGDLPAPSIAASRQVALSLAAIEALKWLSTGESPLIGAMCTLDLATLESRLHQVRGQAACLCAGGDAERSSRIQLQSRLKASTHDGGHRAVHPEQMARSFNALVSPITGIVQAVSAATSSDLVHTCTSELAVDVEPLLAGATARPSRAAGKGMSALQARASALGEAVERYSAIYRASDVSESASYESMLARGRHVVHPASCLLVSARQYATRHDTDGGELAQLAVPDPFNETLPVDWSEAWSMTFDRPCHVATAYGFFGYPTAQEHRFCRADSNGCAAGTSLEDAILQGLFEVIERDALAMWWYNRTPRPAVDLTASGTDYFLRLQAHYQTVGRHYWVLDITSDLGVPTFVSLSTPSGAAGMDGLLLGAGAHADPEVALGRAVTEMNQFLPGWLAGDGRQLFSAVPDAAFLTPAGDPVRNWRTPVGSSDLRDDVTGVIGMLAERGLETIVLNQTRTETGVPSVKVIVPGLRLCRPRFAPGRLFDVPVALGRRTSPLDEAGLNPVHMLM